MLNNINVECTRLKIRKQDLANMLGVSAPTLRGWINKDTMPSSKLRELSKMFHKSADYLSESSDPNLKIAHITQSEAS